MCVKLPPRATSICYGCLWHKYRPGIQAATSHETLSEITENTVTCKTRNSTCDFANRVLVIGGQITEGKKISPINPPKSYYFFVTNLVIAGKSPQEKRLNTSMLTESQVVGANVRRYRKAARWTQEQLAKHANLSSDYVSRLELGKENPTLEVMVRLSKCLGVALIELFKTQDRVSGVRTLLHVENGQKAIDDSI